MGTARMYGSRHSGNPQ
jgi:hypothetical protein